MLQSLMKEKRKRCSWCNNVYSIKNFCTNKRFKDGLLNACKFCISKKWRGTKSIVRLIFKNIGYRICRDCQSLKKNTDFYNGNLCRECREIRWEKWQRKNPGYMNRYRKKRKKTDPIFKLKDNARSLLSNAIIRGELKRSSSCSKCGQLGDNIQAHHEDYGKPLEVIWLCRKCHLDFHHGEIRKYTRKYISK